MALNKKGSFGLDLEEQFKNVESVSSVEKASTPTLTSTLTSTPIKENKTKRLYITTKPSTYQKLDDFAKAKGDSLNNFVNSLMEKFIEENGL